MNTEQAKSELEQLYMSLSEEKKKALDVAFKALEQSMPTMVYPQVDGITPTVVAQADGEKTCVTCRNEDTYHCAECENKSDYEQAQADGEYISRQDAISKIREMAKWHTGDAFNADRVIQHLKQLPSVAIPPDHDGCKDCRWQSQSEIEMPCKQCMHNYTDEWERAKIGHWIWQTEDIYQCSECGEDIHVKEVMNEPQYAWCPICGCPMEIER